MGEKKRIVVGISGASGAPVAIELLKQFRNMRDQVETHLVITEGASITLREETGLIREEVFPMADFAYDPSDMGAAIASGSFHTDGMIIVPCSMKTLAGIYSGYSENLLLRSADVTLKERRKLVIVPRETPLSTIHLRNMYELSLMGAVILPPVIGYYNKPLSVEECTLHIVGKIMDQFGIECAGYCRWNGPECRDGQHENIS